MAVNDSENQNFKSKVREKDKGTEYNMNQPTIVLHVVGRLDIGGAESRIMDLYRNIDREKVQFVFCQHTCIKPVL